MKGRPRMHSIHSAHLAHFLNIVELQVEQRELGESGEAVQSGDSVARQQQYLSARRTERSDKRARCASAKWSLLRDAECHATRGAGRQEAIDLGMNALDRYV